MTKPTPKPIRPKKHKAFPACGTESKVRRGKAKDGELRKRSPKINPLVEELTAKLARKDHLFRIIDCANSVNEATVQAMKAELASLRSIISKKDEALTSIAREEYPVGGQPTRRQLSQIRMKALEALSTPELKDAPKYKMGELPAAKTENR